MLIFSSVSCMSAAIYACAGHIIHDNRIALWNSSLFQSVLVYWHYIHVNGGNMYTNILI